jgi:dTDP-4-dehydrorhamnose reductase
MTDYLPRVLVTGGHGQIASSLCNHPLAAGFIMKFCSHEEFDITQPALIQHVITAFVPDIIINTAAYTAVDKAEEEASAADRANHIGAGHLALACQKNQIKLLHLSTDYVFNGDKIGKYLEDDDADPINIYGKTKWLGEQAVRSNCQNHVILRVSGVFSEHGNNFLRTILKLARERSTLRVVSDQITCPTYAGDIAKAILTICRTPTQQGTFHFCSADAVSWCDFAQAIVDEALQFEKLLINEIVPISSSEYKTAAKRPKNAVLDCSKIASVFNIRQPSWREAISQIFAKLARENA